MPRRSSTAGFSLIELMIALVLGLLVIGAAAGIFLSNQRTFRGTQNLGAVQENARVAFELIGRDLREAAGNPCVNNVPVGNVLNGAATYDWFTNIFDWGAGLQGYDDADAMSNLGFGTGANQRVSGTDGIQIISSDEDVATISAHNTSGATFTVTGSHAYAPGDIMIACNARQASIFQATAATSTSVSHGTGVVTPGNCTSGLALQAAGVCSASGKTFQYEAPNSVLTKLRAVRWWIGNNASGGRSLFQTHLSGGTTAGVTSDEIAEGVDDMQVTYLLDGATQYVPAGSVGAGNWGNVHAIQIDLTMHNANAGTDGAGSDIIRRVIQVASLRNRNP